MDVFITFFQWIIDGFANILKYAIFLLPDSPFNFLSTGDTDIARWIRQMNWIIPISSILLFLQAWIAAVLVFYFLKVILRWAKVLQ